MKLHHERKRMRLSKYDYSMAGSYFVTACTKDRELLFDTPEAKLAVKSAWDALLDIFANLELGEFIVMPNHVHCLICITRDGSYRLHPGTWKHVYGNQRRDGQVSIPTLDNPKYETLSNIIGAFKTTAATQVNKLRGRIGTPVWQKSFHDRVVRNVQELEQIRQYILYNPMKWQEDRDNPAGSGFCMPTKSMADYWNEICE